MLNASLCVVRIRMEAPNSHLFCLALRNCGLALSMEYSADNRQQSPEIFWANSSSEWAGSVGGLRSGCGQLWGRRNQQREASLTWRLQASQLFSTGYSGIQIATSPAICIHSTNNLHQRYLRARSQVFPNRPPQLAQANVQLCPPLLHLLKSPALHMTLFLGISVPLTRST